MLSEPLLAGLHVELVCTQTVSELLLRKRQMRNTCDLFVGAYECSVNRHSHRQRVVGGILWYGFCIETWNQTSAAVVA